MIEWLSDLYLDGATGSELIARAGVPIGYPPELLNLEQPDIVCGLQREYVAAGSGLIYANTFGANALRFGDRLEEILSAAIAIARRAADGRAKVALDIGSLGKLIGDGGISFDDAYEQFAQIVRAAADRTDCIVIETMTDLAETRAAVLAAKAYSRLPILVSMSFSEGGRTAFGCGVENFAYTIGAMGVAAIGINCSLGPIQMLPLARRLVECTDLPVFIKPNAGMPRLENGNTVYDITPEQFCEAMARIKEIGVRIMGGCCGTSPAYIERLKAVCDCVRARRAQFRPRSVVCSASRVAEIDDAMRIVGERINPTGKKRFQQALRERDYDYILLQGIEQEEQGADILDVNVGLNGIDEAIVMREVVERLQRVTTLPLQIDSSDPDVIECALRYYHGKAIVNSVNGTEESLQRILPIVARYGAAVVGLTLDERGISQDIDERVRIAASIVEACRRYGIAARDVYIDTLTMAQASMPDSALCTLGALEQVKRLGVRTILGVSNISFGMPNREEINAAFLQMARQHGLDLCIIHPKLQHVCAGQAAFDFLNNLPGATQAYIDYATQIERTTQTLSDAACDDADIRKCIVGGRGAQVAAAVERLLRDGASPMRVAAEHMIPALDEVGEAYERGKLFLPQLIAAADAAKCGFGVLEKAMERVDGRDADKVFVLATVKGDIHDIGKNIVKAIVSNYGFKVVDLGRDVAYERVLESVRAHYPCVLGLSALMTTTAQNMARTIQLVRAEFPEIPVLVGGAVLTPQYAESIGGTYCRDASATVRRLQEIYA